MYGVSIFTLEWIFEVSFSGREVYRSDTAYGSHRASDSSYNSRDLGGFGSSTYSRDVAPSSYNKDTGEGAVSGVHHLHKPYAVRLLFASCSLLALDDKCLHNTSLCLTLSF